MFTVRNVFDIMYKGKLISYYVYEQNSSSKKYPSHLWCAYFWKHRMVFYEQVCVRKRTLTEIAPNCYSRIQCMRPRHTQKHCNLRKCPTVDLMKHFLSFTDTSIDDGWCNVPWFPAMFRFHDTGNQHNHGINNDSKASIVMLSRKSHKTTVGAFFRIK